MGIKEKDDSLFRSVLQITTQFSSLTTGQVIRL